MPNLGGIRIDLMSTAQFSRQGAHVVLYRQALSLTFVEPKGMVEDWIAFHFFKRYLKADKNFFKTTLGKSYTVVCVNSIDWHRTINSFIIKCSINNYYLRTCRSEVF